MLDQIEIPGQSNDLARDRRTLGKHTRALDLLECGLGIRRRVEVRDDDISDPDRLANPPFAPAIADLDVSEIGGVVRRCDEDRIRLTGNRRAQKAVVEPRDPPRGAGRTQSMPCNREEGASAAPFGELRNGPHGNLLQTDDVRLIRDGELDHLAQVAAAGRRQRVAVEEVPAANKERHRRGYCTTSMKVVLADPPAYTPPYDRALATALARAGADVELVTTQFRHGSVAEPDGYRVRDLFYPLSSRLPGSRARLAVKAVEHVVGLARLAMVRADVVHLQWADIPQLDAWLLRTRAPLVFTAHDLLPRRTAHRADLWRRLFRRFDRVVVHSESGRQALMALGVAGAKLRVIHHPVFRGPVERRDDGHTAIALGLIRPYKGLGDSIEAVRRVEGARLLVAGDAREPLDGYRAAAGPLAEWRLGWMGPSELADVLGRATVALFPYRPEIDQSGALLQALGAGVPAIVYDVGGLAEPVRAFGAGRVVTAGSVDGLTTALHELLGDPAALAAACAGAERARDELTWEASAAAHLSLYGELV